MAHGPKAAANPWRAHTLEWQVSSPPPIFNFDEVPTVVGGPYEYGVPGRCTACSRRRRPRPAVPAPAAAAGRRHRLNEPRTQRILVVANETVGGKALIDAVKRHADAGEVVGARGLPAEPAQARLRDLRRHASARPPRTGSSSRSRSCSEVGIEADGEVMDPDPYAATMDALGENDYDEIIVSTHPETRSGWLRQDLVDRLREGHRAARSSTWWWTSTPTASDGKRTLVVANQTVGGEALIEQLKEKAEEEGRTASS